MKVHLCKKVVQKFISILLCVSILSSSMFLYLPKNNIINTSNVIEITQEEINIIDNNTIEVSDNIGNPQITSRSGIDRKKVEQEKTIYEIYELIINNKTYLYFDNLDKVEIQKDYLIRNTENLSVYINSITSESLNILSDEFTINNTVENYILKYKKKVTCFPTISHRVTSTYGNRATRNDFHSGIDLAGNYGDNIYAYKSGKVIKVQYSNVSYGNMVLIEHDNGMKTRYAHMSSIIVKNGQNINCGETIGYMGSTGNSTGNHLHFEVIINDKTVNPYNYIF